MITYNKHIEYLHELKRKIMLHRHRLTIIMMLVILLGQIDLSVPWVVAVGAMMACAAAAYGPVGVFLAIPFGIFCGVLIGLVNGIGVAYLRIPSMIITLATNAVAQGLMVVYTGGFSPQDSAPAAVRYLATGFTVPGVPNAVVIWALIGAATVFVLTRTSFGRAVYENIPKMMFIFLPLIAVVMFVLYLGSGRFYVEHLLFFVHFHAFFFLCGIAILVLERSSSMLVDTVVGSGLKTAEDILTAVIVFYVPYYLYRAMRRVYGQGRIVTLVKYSLLSIGYLIFMTLTVVGLLAYTALTL